jgi:succinylarginine dihydrolase
LHGLKDDGVVYAQQNPAVIDAGVFHNDVIAVGNGEVLFYHEDAFLNTEQMLAELQGKLGKLGGNFQSVCVPRAQVSVEDAVRSYLFNSQLLSRAAGIVAAALVVDGGIYRHEFVAQSVVSGLMQVQLETEVPVFSVSLTPHHFHAGSEHQTFFYEHFVHKGQEAARTCADTLHKVRAIRRSEQKLAV